MVTTTDLAVNKTRRHSNCTYECKNKLTGDLTPIRRLHPRDDAAPFAPRRPEPRRVFVLDLGVHVGRTVRSWVRFRRVANDEVVHRGVDDFQVWSVEEHRLDVAFVYGPVHLRAWSSHGGPLGRVEDPELDPGGVRGGAHDPAERVDLAYERALGEASDGWVAGHLADGAERGWGDERDARAPTRGGGGGLGARVASADDDDVEVGGGLGGGGREAPRASVGGC